MYLCTVAGLIKMEEKFTSIASLYPRGIYEINLIIDAKIDAKLRRHLLFKIIRKSQENYIFY